MKLKIFLLMAIVSLITLSSNAQNANRSGCFFEIGTGALIGNNPIADIKMGEIVKENNSQNYHQKTTEIFGEPFRYNVNFGYRLATSKHCAFDLKLKGIFNYDYNIIDVSMFGGSFGFRYTTAEIYRNISIYTSTELGYLGYQYKFAGSCDTYISGSIGLGLNLTNRLYTGLTWEILSRHTIGWDYWFPYYNQLLEEDKGSMFSLIGFNFGYRF